MHHNMTFFDKFFTIKNRNNKNENGLKCRIEPLSFSSSNLDIGKEQIRVVLFRECDRRGRKLLFDSHSVEKLPLASLNPAGYICKAKCDQVNRKFDFVEITKTHGYRYKKPCNDVTSLGEMIFGSVAMVYKGGNTCKIHSIPLPKRVMFTTVVHAPSHCHYRTTSEKSLDGSSFSSLNEISDFNQTSSSDSKLYRHEDSAQLCTWTYPCLKHKSCFKTDEGDLNKSFLRKSQHNGCLESLCSENQDRYCESKQVSDSSIESIKRRLNNLRRHSDCKYFESHECLGSSNVMLHPTDDFKNGSTSNLSDWSGSLGSLRRRWMQSCAASVDANCFDETENIPSKTRTKLGLGLVLDLSDTLQDEMEKFLFNHTIIIDSIINKLQSCVEMAYLRKESFVDVIYAGFLDCQQSMYELITGGKYARPMWLTLADETKKPELKTPFTQTIYNQFQENLKNCKKPLVTNNLKLQFLNDFSEILTKFDTKDTNFFISTLLTAVLTHHLSWVTGVAESDSSSEQEKLRSAMKKLRPYNPIWAQINDLHGILGSPLKSTKTIITGSEFNKNSMAMVIQVLTYFVRCYNVHENIYDVRVDEVTNFDESYLYNRGKYAEDFENFDSGIDCTFNGGSGDVETKKQTKTFVKKATEVEDFRRIKEDALQRSCPSTGLKRSKSCLSRLKNEDNLKKTSNKLYPSIEDLAKMENVRISDLDSDRTVFVEKVLNRENVSEKIHKLIRVPNKAVICHLERNLSPDEGYDTVDGEIFTGKTESEFCSRLTSVDKSENVLFVLGENEELVNLSKKVITTKSSVIDLEKEDSKDKVLVDSKKTNIGRSKSMNIPVSRCENNIEKRCRTLDNAFSDYRDIDFRTLWENDGKSEHSESKIEESKVKAPWIRCELPMPRTSKCGRSTTRLDVSSVLGSVNDRYNSEQIIQGILEKRTDWEGILRKDLCLCARNSVLERELSEALCILADMDSWEVSICSSHTYVVDKSRYSGVRVGMSQIVADMLESFLQLHRMKLSPEFCLYHIERKLYEIYSKSKSLAELLNTTELCTMEYLTKSLEIEVNDVPLLLAVATTHSPQITSKYGLSIT